MSEIRSVFDFRVMFFDSLFFREVIVKKPKFHEKKSRKIHIFDNNFPKIKCVTKPHPEIKNWEYFRHSDTLTTFWGAFKKMYDICEVGVKVRKMHLEMQYKP